MSTMTPGQVAGPYEDKCSGCRMFRCDCPVGYMNHLGYTHCIECATGNGERQPHATWEPVRLSNLDSLDERCDGCQKVLAA